VSEVRGGGKGDVMEGERWDGNNAGVIVQASRDELKKDDIKSIAPAMNEFSTQLDAFVKVAS
jgi:hypothetical protein